MSGDIWKGGQEFLERDPLNKHRERFKSIEISLNGEIDLLSLNTVGSFILESGQRFVETDDVRYLITDSAIVNNRLKAGDKVFSAVYAEHGQVFVNFVEPYFENIDHLNELR